MQPGESMMVPVLDHACGLNKQGQAPSWSRTHFHRCHSSRLPGHAEAVQILLLQASDDSTAEVARIDTHLNVRDRALQPQQGALEEGCCASRAAHCLLRVPAESSAVLQSAVKLCESH